MRSLLVLLLLVAAACGETVTAAPDAGGDGIDAAPGPDAAPPRGPTPSRAVLSGAGTVTGGAFTLDVQIGQVFVPRPASGGELTLTPNEPIHP